MPGPPQPVHSLLYRWPDTAKYYWEQWEGEGVPGDVRRAVVKMKSGRAMLGRASVKAESGHTHFPSLPLPGTPLHVYVPSLPLARQQGVWLAR